jgi:hypothetical protein
LLAVVVHEQFEPVVICVEPLAPDPDSVPLDVGFNE